MATSRCYTDRAGVLTYSADAELDALFDRVAAGEPDVDFTAPDGVHTSWTIAAGEDTAFVESRLMEFQICTSRTGIIAARRLRG